MRFRRNPEIGVEQSLGLPQVIHVLGDTRDLLGRGASVKAYDPKAMENAKRLIDGTIEYAESALDAIGIITNTSHVNCLSNLKA